MFRDSSIMCIRPFRNTKGERYILNTDQNHIPYAPTTIARSKYGGAGFSTKEGQADYLTRPPTDRNPLNAGALTSFMLRVYPF